MAFNNYIFIFYILHYWELEGVCVKNYDLALESVISPFKKNVQMYTFLTHKKLHINIKLYNHEW